MLYYNEIDTIYENLIRRMNTHSLRVTSTPDDYNNYMNRIKKKVISLEKRANTKFAYKCFKDLNSNNKTVVMNKLNDSNYTLDKEFKQKLEMVNTTSNIVISYNKDDLYMIGLTDNDARINNVYKRFYDILKSLNNNDNVPELIMDSDQESDNSESESDLDN